MQSILRLHSPTMLLHHYVKPDSLHGVSSFQFYLFVSENCRFRSAPSTAQVREPSGSSRVIIRCFNSTEDGQLTFHGRMNDTTTRPAINRSHTTQCRLLFQLNNHMEGRLFFSHAVQFLRRLSCQGQHSALSSSVRQLRNGF